MGHQSPKSFLKVYQDKWAMNPKEAQIVHCLSSLQVTALGLLLKAFLSLPVDRSNFHSLSRLELRALYGLYSLDKFPNYVSVLEVWLAHLAQFMVLLLPQARSHQVIFNIMRELKVKGCSGLCTLASSDGESHIKHSESVGGDETCSSLHVHSTPEIEKKYVHRVYDAIAPHFSATRFAKWPKVATFLNSLPSGSLILDAGCGNGKYLGLNPDCFFIGCDISDPLIKICADRGHEVLVADAVNLPYRTGYGDASISIAVLHHLSTENRRKKAIEELIRVVKKGGMVLITVWAAEQEDRSLVTKWTPLAQKYVEEWIGPGTPHVRSPSSLTLQSIPEAEESNSKEQLEDTKEILNEKLEETVHLSSQDQDGSVFLIDAEDKQKQQEYFVPWHLPYHRAEVSGASASALASGLARKDDKKGAVVYDRYYHVFSEGELARLVSGMRNAVVVDQFFDKSNWCIILEKIS
ncbi:tRNA (carboxymethyluridine(34)-5-O)-methyltransferase-like isoform X2 [Tripterygium wilfordii]|uniref:tRNA (carboxymethyluridine(34)-5-O)-methyltransferase-like isoform X2 n=1 Tax=Tripterygium wilfordii TaxID=458696 RepID=UPI0018F7F2F6|nr:tRNA (carboxymethyluridine(34)-5-O)-methyltransferase-like isoform X2 [Tripterygium wilfordii]